MNPSKAPWLSIAFALYAVSTLISMATMSIGAAILAVALVFLMGGPAAYWTDFRSTLREPLVKLYGILSLVLLTACALSLIVAKIAPLGWGGKYVEAHFFADMAKSWYFLWPIAMLPGLRWIGLPGQRLVLRSWLIACGVVSVIGIVQYFTGWPRGQLIPGGGGKYHAIMFLGHHLSVASILIFPFFAILDFLKDVLTKAKEPAPFKLVPLAAIAVATLIAMFLTYSRMLWLAVPLGMMIWILRALPRKYSVAAVVLLFAGVGLVSQVPFVQTRMRDSSGIGDRQILWKANFEFFRLRPFTGAGFRRNIEASSYYLESLPQRWDGFILSGHAHNNAIDMLGGTGLIGLLAWLAWCIGLFWILGVSVRRGPKPLGFAWGLVCAWIVFQFNGLTQVNFWEGKVMHQMMWALAWSLLWATQGRRHNEIEA